MKLHSVNVLVLNDSNEFGAVAARGYGVGIVIRNACCVGMSKIKVSIRRDAVEQSRTRCAAQLIPSHMREFYIRRKSANSLME